MAERTALSWQRQPVYNAVMTTPFGRIGIRVNDEALTAIDFLGPRARPHDSDDPMSREVVQQIRAYLRDPGHGFTLPLAVQGSAFQQRVWSALCKMSPGSRISYGQLAHQLGSSPRAVGNACRSNHIPIVIPCHRVVARNGPGGYAGARGGPLLDIKHWLLAHEHGTASRNCA